MTAEVLITSLLTLIDKRQQQCKALGWRLPVWLQGSESTQDSLLTDMLQQRLNGNTNNTLFWLGEPLPGLQQSFAAEAQNTVKHIDKKSQLLGLECDVLLINAHQGINWDLVAASAACVKAGGLWLLVSPPLALWQQQTITKPANCGLIHIKPLLRHFYGFGLISQQKITGWFVAITK